MKPTLFLIGMILSALGITLGIFYDTHYFGVYYFGLAIIIGATYKSKKFCIKFAEYYFNQMVVNETELTTKELLNKFKNENNDL